MSEREKINISFVSQSRSRSWLMLANHRIVAENILYMPQHAIDHRGSALWFYAREKGLPLAFDTFELDANTPTPSEVKRGFEYMFNPKHVLEGIIERMEQRKLNYY